jgi:2-(1,2-epoxy-1,2-dihydrophenyl)acetyl-CoA isomerase
VKPTAASDIDTSGSDDGTESEHSVLLKIDGAVATLTLNRPEFGNAIDLALARQLMQCLQRCEHHPDVRVVVITGAGRLFCAGGDLNAIRGQGEASPVYLKELLNYVHESISIIASIPVPVIAAINGTAAGAGFALACGCDFVVAARSARFLMAYTRVGLTPDASSTWYLPRIIGLHRALALTLLNDELSAETLQEWGVVTEVVHDGALEDAVAVLANRLAAGAKEASGAAKRLLRGALGNSLESQMIAEAEALCSAVLGAEAQAGLEAFNNKN